MLSFKYKLILKFQAFALAGFFVVVCFVLNAFNTIVCLASVANYSNQAKKPPFYVIFLTYSPNYINMFSIYMYDWKIDGIS